MILKNGMVMMPSGIFQQADIVCRDGVIDQVLTSKKNSVSTGSESKRDIEGLYVLPGFIDIHTHGIAGHDFCDGTSQGLEKMLRAYATLGVTSVLPTTMSFPEKILSNIVAYAVPYVNQLAYGAVLRGIHLEGPYLNKAKCGAQNPHYILPPNIEGFLQLQQRANGCIRLVDIAPELEGGMEFIKQIKQICRVSLAHTEADYTTAIAAFQQGASQVTHLYNATTPFAHRDPGVVGAAYEQACFVELISDGIHLHPIVVPATFDMFGSERICLVSDSIKATAMPPGEYDLGGQKILVEDGKAVLAKQPEAIAGSVVPLPEMCRRAISFGVPMSQAVQACTINPAISVGIESTVGSIEVGKQADFVLWDQDFQTIDVLIAGKSILE